MLKYSISIKWSSEDEGFIATVPELTGLSTFGETPEEAISELKIATEAYLESLGESEQVIPSPEELASYSGQTRLRMPKSLHAKLSIAAQSEGVSLNTYLVSLLSERHAHKEALNVLKKGMESIQKPNPLVVTSGPDVTYVDQSSVECTDENDEYITPPGGVAYA